MKYLLIAFTLVVLGVAGSVSAKDSTVEGKTIVVNDCTGCHGT